VSASRSKVWLPLMGAATCVVAGCAGTIVRPSQLPARPQPPAPNGLVLSLSEVPDVMKDEIRECVGPAREVTTAGSTLADSCVSPTEIVLRPRLGRGHFNSNAGDRNALFIYESAIVVGIPVTLISAVSWQWYGEMMKEGVLDWVSCDGDLEERDVWTSVHLRSEGRGFVRGQTIKDAQDAAALRALARKLVAEWTRAVSQEGEKRP